MAEKKKQIEDSRDIFEKALDNPIATLGAVGGAVVAGRYGARLGKKLGLESGIKWRAKEWDRWRSSPEGKAYKKRQAERDAEWEKKKNTGSMDDYYDLRSRLGKEQGEDFRRSGGMNVRSPNYDRRMGTGTGLGATVGAAAGAGIGGSLGAQGDKFEVRRKRKR